MDGVDSRLDPQKPPRAEFARLGDQASAAARSRGRLPAMPTALVVDDAQVSRWLAGEILRTRTDLTVAFATSGEEALEHVEREVPDIVVTDMMMPGMDGLQLVSALQKSHPAVPVIVMTAFGSEELAAGALRAGAASYLPKRHLSRDLEDVVRRVRNAAGGASQKAVAGVSGALTTYEITLDNDIERIGPLIAYFRAEIVRTGLCDETELMQFAVALDEALNNAICHGNLEVDSTIREESMQAYLDRVRERRDAEPYKDRRTHVRLDLTPERAVCVIRDEGGGFDGSAIPDPTDPVNLDRPSGRGLVLMHTFCDEVKFDHGGAQVTLIKRASSAAGS